MNRLTKDDVKEMGMIELSHNQVFVKNREAWYRDYDMEITARDLAQAMFARNGIDCPAENDEFDEYMLELLQDGYETLDGMIALYYNALWAFAEVREKLKAYEDTGLEPEEFNDLKVCLEDEGDVGGTIRDLIELMQYRKLEAEGRLIKLPCKLGSTVYGLNQYGDGTFEDEIYADEADSISISKNKEGQITFTIDCTEYVAEDFGVIAFHTQEDAEKALEAANV